ncbi:hypothetical protein LEPN108286_07230 [Legionella pneumophila subsp. pneumophila]
MLPVTLFHNLCTILFLRGVNWETKMGLHEELEDQSFSDYSYDEEIDDHIDDLNQKKKIRRMLEDRLERKRLKEEFKDDFDELSGEFDWDELDK